MHMAHALFNHFQDLEAVSVSGKHSWGDALTEAWRILRVRQALGKGVYYLTYFKGIEIQCRRGTLCPKYIPSDQAPKGAFGKELASDAANGIKASPASALPTGRASLAPVGDPESLRKINWGVINYYDLDKKGWRSFKIAALQRAKRITVDIRYITCDVDTESIYD